MPRSSAALSAIFAGVIAACVTSHDPLPAPVLTPADTVSTVSAIPAATASTSMAQTDLPGSPSPASTPGGPLPTPVAVAQRPTGVAFDEKRVGDDPPSTEITQTVSWGAPRSEGVEIRVYGVTECVARPASPAPDTYGPCLVEGTLLPASVRTLLASAPASDGRVSWSWTGTFDCEVGLAYNPRGPAYYSVVLAAYGASDRSIFAIAEPGLWSQAGPEDIVC